MGRKRRTGSGSGPTLQQRLIALGGIVAIVAAVVGLLWAVGLIGNQAGGEGIDDVVISEPVRVAGQDDLEVGTRVGQLAPEFEISDFDGTRHRLSDFRGQPVYVNFWATWCGPCIIELPEIQSLLDDHRDDLVVIAVNRTEPLDRAESFLQNLPRDDGGTGLAFSVDAMDPSDALYNEFVPLFPPPMPASVFVDRSGVVSDVFFGLIPLATMQDAVAKASAQSTGLVEPSGDGESHQLTNLLLRGTHSGSGGSSERTTEVPLACEICSVVVERSRDNRLTPPASWTTGRGR